MRQAALVVILACAGSYVPASKALIGPIDRIFTRMGSSDDTAGGRSTFMVEMTRTANILHNASRHSLVLMDEVAAAPVPLMVYPLPTPVPSIWPAK